MLCLIYVFRDIHFNQVSDCPKKSSVVGILLNLDGGPNDPLSIIIK